MTPPPPPPPPSGAQREKVNSRFEFPLDLNLRPCVRAIRVRIFPMAALFGICAPHMHHAIDRVQSRLRLPCAAPIWHMQTGVCRYTREGILRAERERDAGAARAAEGGPAAGGGDSGDSGGGDSGGGGGGPPRAGDAGAAEAGEAPPSPAPAPPLPPLREDAYYEYARAIRDMHFLYGCPFDVCKPACVTCPQVRTRGRGRTPGHGGHGALLLVHQGGGLQLYVNVLNVHCRDCIFCGPGKLVVRLCSISMCLQMIVLCLQMHSVTL